MSWLVRHPATLARLKEVADRWFSVRKQHQRASDLMWAGMLAASFTDQDLQLLRDFGYLCPNDERLIVAARKGPR